MMDELVQAVGRSAGLAPEQASAAVGSMLRFLASRLPSPLFGELQSHLQAGPGTAAPAGPPPTTP